MSSYLYHQITSTEFYKLGGFANPALFRNSNGHFIIKDHVNYKECLKQLKEGKSK